MKKKILVSILSIFAFTQIILAAIVVETSCGVEVLTIDWVEYEELYGNADQEYGAYLMELDEAMCP